MKKKKPNQTKHVPEFCGFQVVPGLLPSSPFFHALWVPSGHLLEKDRGREEVREVGYQSSFDPSFQPSEWKEARIGVGRDSSRPQLWRISLKYKMLPHFLPLEKKIEYN